MSGDDAHDHGLRHDLPRLLARRETLLTLGGLAAAGAALGYGRLARAQTATAPDGTVCVADAPATAGPFPADGTNSRAGQTLNVLTQNGVIREDLRPSFAGMDPVADGVRLDAELRLVSVRDACTPLAGRAVYLWHCDAAARYSLYDAPDRNYCRGVGITDDAGRVRFTTVFPGCYGGRWPHLHFEVFASPEDAASGRASQLISQLALPQAECTAVYAADARYAGSAAKLTQQSLARDMVFRGSSQAQMAQRTLTLAGSPEAGFSGQAMIALGA